jgi:hypothetical protein
MDRTPGFSAVLPQLRKQAITLAGALIIAGFASPALAAPETSTKVVRCGDQSCLLVTGYRADPASIVSINGRAVTVEGEHGWRVRVPVATVRQWSAPFARTIAVALHDKDARRETVDTVDLPVGLLGQVANLASLEVRVQ